MLALYADFDDRALRRFASALSEPRLLAASRRATSKAARWMHTQVSRQVGDEEQLPKRLIRVSRGKVYDKGWRRNDANSGYAYKVWLGLNPLPADKLGRIRKLGKGYSVMGGRRFPGAFMPLRHPLYAGKLYQRTTKYRFPVQRVMVEWHEAGRKAFEQNVPRLQVRYRELMLQELRFEVLRAASASRA